MLVVSDCNHDDDSDDDDDNEDDEINDSDDDTIRYAIVNMRSEADVPPATIRRQNTKY